MNPKGLAIVLIGSLIVLVSAGAYVLTLHKTSPSLAPPSGTGPLPSPPSAPNPVSPFAPPPPILSPSCVGVSNTFTAELDGQAIKPLTARPLSNSPYERIISGTDYETINGGQSFDLMASIAMTDTHIQKTIFVGALKLTPGVQTPESASFHIEYREYDTSAVPFTYKVNFMPQILAGRVETKDVATKPGEHVCGTFDVIGTGTYGIGGGGIHSIHLRGSFNEVVPPPRPGSP